MGNKSDVGLSIRHSEPHLFALLHRALAFELLAQLGEEFVLHLLPHRLHEPRAHLRDQPADLALRLALELASLGRDPDACRPFHQVRAVVRASDAEAAGTIKEEQPLQQTSLSYIRWRPP